MIIQYSYELAISLTHSKRKNVSLHNSKMINETFTLLCSILINWLIDSFLLVREIYLLGGWTEGFVLQHEYIRHQSSSSFLSIRETGLLLLVCAVCGSGDCLFFFFADCLLYFKKLMRISTMLCSVMFVPFGLIYCEIYLLGGWTEGFLFCFAT